MTSCEGSALPKAPAYAISPVARLESWCALRRASLLQALAGSNRWVPRWVTRARKCSSGCFVLWNLKEVHGDSSIAEVAGQGTGQSGGEAVVFSGNQQLLYLARRMFMARTKTASVPEVGGEALEFHLPSAQGGQL